MTDQQRYDALRARAAHRRATMPDYPDTPEQVAEQAALTAAFMPLQLHAMALAEEHEEWAALGFEPRTRSLKGCCSTR